MPRKCAVRSCGNIQNHASGISLHTLSGGASEEVKKTWRDFCMGNYLFPTICSQHFEAKSLLINPANLKQDHRARQNLKANAVPTIQEPSRKASRRDSKQVILEELIADSGEEESRENINMIDAENLIRSGQSSGVCTLWAHESVKATSEKKIKEQYEEEFQKMRTEIEKLKEENETLKQENSELREAISRNCETKENAAKIEKLLSSVFTKNQLDLILKRKSRVVWNNDEIQVAFAIRYLSKRCYTYLRDKLRFPFPSISTLQNWASKFDVKRGVFEDVLNMMKTAAIKMSEMDKVCILSFDEVSVKTAYTINKKDDEVLDPVKDMQVVMVRGLFKQWKQPIFADFTKMTREILLDLIEKLHARGFSVTGVVSDCGGGNRGCWKALRVSVEKSYFVHPITGKNIYVFGDAPHLLKLLRNWLLDKGFQLKDGSRVTRKPLDDLLQFFKHRVGEIHTMHLTEKHLTCQKVERQNVRLATQLISRKTAAMLQMHWNDSKEAEALSDSILLWNNWFDIFNVYRASPSVDHFKSPYGVFLEQQDEVLNKMTEFISSMKIIQGRQKMEVFQKAILMSIRSLQMLFADLRSEFEIQYLLTSRLNQDCLESFFSVLRQAGGMYDHPSPVEALQRIKLIILGKFAVLGTHTNFLKVEDDEDGYLISEVFKKLEAEVVCEDESVEAIPSLAVSSLSTVSAFEGNEVENIHSDSLEKDGLEYISGCLARKFLILQPALGQRARQGGPSWISHITHGGLIQPSVDFEKYCHILEKLFKAFHGASGLGCKQNIHKSTSQFLKDQMSEMAEIHHFNMPDKIIEEFVKMRVTIRVQYLNKKRKEDEEKKAQKRRRHQEKYNESKMRKILN